MAQVRTQNPQNLILSKKAIKKVIKELNNNEYYKYTKIPESLNEILNLITNPWLDITQGIRISRVETDNKVFYIILLETDNELIILRDDNRNFEMKLSENKNIIMNIILRIFRIGYKYQIITNKNSIFIVTENPLEFLTKNSWVKLQYKDIEFFVFIKEKNVIEIHGLIVKPLILYRALNGYSLMNSRLPFF